MADVAIALVLGILLLFGLIIVLMMRSARRDRENKLKVNQSLGFSPVEPDPGLVRKISLLYQGIGRKRARAEGDFLELQNVFRKTIAQGEMFIFDLRDNSGDDTSYLETQAVAIFSPSLNLPTFAIFPKADVDGAAANLANKVLGWLIAKMGSPVAFPHFPEFEQRYLVSSPFPDETRAFLEDHRLGRLARTRLLGIQAGGNLFVLSRYGETGQRLTSESLRERVDQAMFLFSVFLS